MQNNSKASNKYKLQISMPYWLNKWELMKILLNHWKAMKTDWKTEYNLLV